MAEVFALSSAEERPIGGKAEGLARLIRLGLAVPPGVVIVGAQTDDDLSALLVAEVDPDCMYAVRSSAIGEDGDTHSFAGQFHTELNCKGLPAILAGIATCLESARSARVKAYAGELASHHEVAMAVIVQQMVDAQRAGVLFTADPVTSRRDQWVLEVVNGLGESLVSGQSAGERSVYDRRGRRILGPGISVESGLLEGARRLMADVGGPVDIEFAVDQQGTLWFLQGRPVTALDAVHPNELDNVDDHPGAVYTTANVSEMMPGPVTPLTYSVFGRAVDRGMQDYMTRIGVQPRPVDEPRYIYSSYQHFFIRLDALYGSAQACMGASKRDVDLAVVGRPVPEASVGKPRPWYVRLYNLMRLLRYLGQAQNRLKALQAMAENFVLDDDGSVDGLYAALDKAQATLVAAYEHHYAASVFSGTWLGVLSGAIAGRGQVPTAENLALVAALLSDIDDVESADAVCALQRLGRTLSNHPAARAFSAMPVDDALRWLRTEAEPEVERFIQRHGHRCVREAELRTRPWRDDADAWVPMLQAVVVAPAAEPSVSAADASSLLAPLSASARRTVQWVRPRARHGVAMRELSKSNLIRFQDHLKRGYRVLGARMTAQGILPEADLIYFYTHRELAAVIDGDLQHAQAERRRAQLDDLWTLRFPVISIGAPVPVPETPLVAEGDLVGTPVSRGVVEGRVVVAHTVEEASRLEVGDILVARTTDVGWSPWFAVAGGVVTEIGSPLSHGAVVAREYGIPAVVGVAGATQLDAGAMIRVDGGAGTVTVLDDASMS